MSDDFVIHDKRLFNKDGQVNPEAAEGGGQADKAPEPQETLQGFNDETYSSADLPPADLASLIVGLATSALIHMGESPEPGAPKTEPNFVAAKHAIDLLAVLQVKTKGNLENEEEALLNTLLYDLRLKFVKISGQ